MAKRVVEQLIEAARLGNVEALNTILDDGADINEESCTVRSFME